MDSVEKQVQSEIKKELSIFFDKYNDMVKNMTQEEEREYIKKYDLNKKIKQIAIKTRKKYVL